MSLRLESRWLAVQPFELTGDLCEEIMKRWGKERGVLLAHAMDGLIWGRLDDDGALSLAPTAPPLRSETLLDLRVFADERELRAWRTLDGLSAVEVREGSEGKLEFAAWEERHWQLLRSPGAGVRVADSEFVTLRGLAGERQTLPGKPGKPMPGTLVVRHYYERDEESGLLRLAEHRWLRLETEA